MKTKYRGAMTANDPKPEDLQALFSHGANLIRYQMYVWDAETKSTTQWAEDIQNHLNYFNDHISSTIPDNVKVIFDIHTPPGGQKLWDDPANLKILIDTWDYIAFVYKDNPKIYAYDICNEPPGTDIKVANLMDKCSEAIRAKDANRYIVVSPPYGDPRNFPRLKKSRFKNIYYTAHFYRPGDFCGQGIGGVPTGKVYPSTGCNKDTLRKWLDPIVQFQKRTGVSLIFIGEFSSSIYGADSSTIAWCQDLIDIYESNAWQWTFHCWREDDHSPWNAERSPAFLKMLSDAWSKN